MLEYNLYDNFNPNVYSFATHLEPSNAPKLPDPKNRGVIMDYELWQTGYKYTSSGTISTDVEVGDIIEILHPEEYLVPVSDTTVFNKKLSMFYLVTSKDESNKVTLKNYVWAMIEGLEIPTTALKQTNQQIIVNMMSPAVASLVSHGYNGNSNEINIPVKWNRKSETDEMSNIAKDLCRVIRLQPSVYYQGQMVPRPDGSLEPVDNNIFISFFGREWNRKEKSIRVDFNQNVSIEHEVITERSNYNYLNAYVKKVDGTYNSYGQQWTINDKNKVVDMYTYRGDGHELPKQRLVKSVFYDEAPSNGEIKSQITKDSTVINLYFNQHPLMKLVLNDLVEVWYNDKNYHGYIADRCFTETNGGITWSAGYVKPAGALVSGGSYPVETVPVGYRPWQTKDITFSLRTARNGLKLGRLQLLPDGRMSDMFLFNEGFRSTADAMMFGDSAMWITKDPFPTKDKINY